MRLNSKVCSCNDNSCSLFYLYISFTPQPWECSIYLLTRRTKVSYSSYGIMYEEDIAWIVDYKGKSTVIFYKLNFLPLHLELITWGTKLFFFTVATNTKYIPRMSTSKYNHVSGIALKSNLKIETRSACKI